MPRSPNLSRGIKPFDRKTWAQPLAELVGAAMDPMIAKLGFTESSLILNWDEIVGARIARRCEPIQLQFRQRNKLNDRPEPEPATLVLRVEGAYALETQHIAPSLIERVNAHFGWACVGRIRMKQAPLQRKVAPPQVPPVSAENMALATVLTGEIENERLRTALVKLGARVLQEHTKSTHSEKK